MELPIGYRPRSLSSTMFYNPISTTSRSSSVLPYISPRRATTPSCLKLNFSLNESWSPKAQNSYDSVARKGGISFSDRMTIAIITSTYFAQLLFLHLGLNYHQLSSQFRKVVASFLQSSQFKKVLKATFFGIKGGRVHFSLVHTVVGAAFILMVAFIICKCGLNSGIRISIYAPISITLNPSRNEQAPAKERVELPPDEADNNASVRNVNNNYFF